MRVYRGFQPTHAQLAYVRTRALARHVQAAAHAEAVSHGAGSAKPRAAKVLPEFVDVFGWCTWDAFYSRVSAEGPLHI